MKKRILSAILIIATCICTLSFSASSDAEDLMKGSYEYHSKFYYDSANPYNNVYGNDEYAYLCYIDTDFSAVDKLLFTHKGSIVKNTKTNENLLKMYMAQNAERSAAYSIALQRAHTIIDVAGDLRFSSFVDSIGSIAASSLGDLTAFCFSGGASTYAQIAEVLADATVDELKDHFLNVGNILSEAQLKIFYACAEILEEYVEILDSEADYRTFKNCEKFADTADKMTKTVGGAMTLMSEITSELDTNFFSILGGYLLDAAKGFVGSFAEFIVSADEMMNIVNTDSEYVAKLFTLAKNLAELKDITSLEEVGSAIELVDLVADNSLTIIVAYRDYLNAITPMSNLRFFNDAAVKECTGYENPEKTEFLNDKFYPTVNDGIYTLKNADSGLMMNVYGGKNADETNVVTWKFDGTKDQKFYIKHIENGKYAIFAVCSDNGKGSYTRCIDVYTGAVGSLPEAGDNVDIYTRSTSWNEAQLFYIVLTEYGTYAFESAYSPQCVIGAKNPSVNNGNIVMDSWSSELSQTWELCNAAGFVESDVFENDYENTGDYNEDIVGVANTQLGYIELDPASGEPVFYTPDDLDSGIVKPFYTKYGDCFGNSDGQWCAYFVMWCAKEAGIPKDVLPQARKYGNCGTFVQWFKDNGKWKEASYTPTPGDIVFFHKSGKVTASHVGIVESVNDDGSINTIEGNTLNANYYQVATKTHSSNILGYGTLSDTTESYVNGFISEGGKTSGKAYMLPDKNSNTVWYVDEGDRCIVLCYDSETDFYLLMYPFLSTGKYVIAYVPADIVGIYMEPYIPVPDASDFYNVNKTVYLTEKTTAYHNPSVTALMNGNSDVRVRTEWSAGEAVTVLFEYNNYYFVVTEAESGFVPKEKIDLNNTVAPEAPPAPSEPTPPEEEVYASGDVNMDGEVSRADATLILEYCASLCVLDEKQLVLADANGDGSVNVADASFIFAMIRKTEG